MKRLMILLMMILINLALAPSSQCEEPQPLRYLGSMTMKLGIIDKIAPMVSQKNNLGINADASGSTSAGIDEVLKGKADIVGSGGAFSEDALAKGITPTLIGSDILGIVVNKDNPVKELSRAQLKDIFAGTITNWSQVGGANLPIIVFTMDKSSAGYELFKDVILDKGNYSEKAVPTRIPMQVAQNVGKVQEGIGFCSLCFIQREPNAKTVAIDGHAPASDSAQYPLTRALYWGTRGAPAGNAKVLMDFVLSDEGQTIVKQSFVGAKESRQ